MPSEPQADKSYKPDEVLTLAEAAAYLRISEETLEQLAVREAIPGQKIGDEWRFLKEALVDWLRYGHGFQRQPKRPVFSWGAEFPLTEMWMTLLEKWMLALEHRLLSKVSGIEGPAEKPGSKQAVLKQFGVFREDTDMEERLAEARAQREAGG